MDFRLILGALAGDPPQVGQMASAQAWGLRESWGWIASAFPESKGMETPSRGERLLSGA